MDKAQRCTTMVRGTGTWGAFNSHQCSRKAVKDGYCKQHHPDEVKRRDERASELYHQKLNNNPAVKLQRELDAVHDKLSVMIAERDEAIAWIRVVGEEVGSGGDRDKTLDAIRRLRAENERLAEIIELKKPLEEKILALEGNLIQCHEENCDLRRENMQLKREVGRQ